MMKGVATLYRWSVSTDHRRRFVQDWRHVARQLQRSGARGCHLLAGGEDEFIGLIRWPSDYARSRSRTAPDSGAAGIRAFDKVELSVEDDLPHGLLLPVLSRVGWPAR